MLASSVIVLRYARFRKVCFFNVFIFLDPKIKIIVKIIYLLNKINKTNISFTREADDKLNLV